MGLVSAWHSATGVCGEGAELMDPVKNAVRAAVVSGVFLAYGCTSAAVDTVVVVRELHSAAGLPFGGTGRIVRWIDGQRVREEASFTMEMAAADSFGRGAQ